MDDPATIQAMAVCATFAVCYIAYRLTGGGRRHQPAPVKAEALEDILSSWSRADVDGITVEGKPTGVYVVTFDQTSREGTAMNAPSRVPPSPTPGLVPGTQDHSEPPTLRPCPSHIMCGCPGRQTPVPPIGYPDL
jgi:hypothetical protein